MPLFFWLDDINTTKFSCIVYVTYQLAQLLLYKAAVVNLTPQIPFSTLTSLAISKNPKTTMQSSNCTPGCILKEQNLRLHKNGFSLICNRPPEQPGVFSNRVTGHMTRLSSKEE